MDKETQYIIKLVTTVNFLAKYVTNISNELHKEWTDNGYVGDIDTAKIEAIYPNMTKSDINGAITLLDQLNNFVGNSAVTTDDYGAKINAVRVHGLV